MNCENVGPEVFERLNNFYEKNKPTKGRCRISTPEGILLIQRSPTTLIINTIESRGPRVDLNRIEVDQMGRIKGGTTYREVITNLHHPKGQALSAEEIVELADLMANYIPQPSVEPPIRRDIPILVMRPPQIPELVGVR